MDFIEGEILLVNKPLHWTSFQAVKKIRYHLQRKTGVKKIKVGHAGTLDPLADGLLIICTGKKTKEIDSLMGMPKTYSGVITLGATTPSYDLETAIDATFPLDDIHEELIRETARKMIGEQLQHPPHFSARKVDGKRAYDLARKGEKPELKPKTITIHTFEILSVNLPHVEFRISCSKGTYIRSIAHDFGKLLHNGGHLSALRRERIGDFDLNKAWQIEDFVASLGTERPE